LHLTVLERELLEQIVFYPALKILLFLTDTRENGIKNRDLGEKSQKIINGEINNILIKNESYQDVYDEVEKERKTMAEMTKEEFMSFRRRVDINSHWEQFGKFFSSL